MYKLLLIKGKYDESITIILGIFENLEIVLNHIKEIKQKIKNIQDNIPIEPNIDIFNPKTNPQKIADYYNSEYWKYITKYNKVLDFADVYYEKVKINKLENLDDCLEETVDENDYL